MLSPLYKNNYYHFMQLILGKPSNGHKINISTSSCIIHEIRSILTFKSLFDK